MSRMDEAMQELVDAIKFSEEYIRYQDIKNRVHNQPQLEQQNPLVAEYLAAENAFCRVVQKVNWTLIEELDFEVGFEE